LQLKVVHNFLIKMKYELNSIFISAKLL